jgi:pilus assembly protein CpaE
MPGLSFVIVSPWREFSQVLESSHYVEIRAQVEQLGDLVRTVYEQRPDALLVSLGENPRATLAALEKLPSPRPLLFVCGPDDSQLILQAMRLGAREYVAPGSDEKDQLLAAVERVAREVSEVAPARAAPLIAVTGAKGGVGTSFVACQLSASLAGLGARPVLVDGQLRRGDVALYLDLAPKYSFASLASCRDGIDPTYLNTTLTEHASGVQVLAAPRRPEEADVVGVECVQGVRDLLREEFDWVIWDTPQDFEDRSLLILDQASLLMLVTTPDVPSLNHTRMQLELLERLGRSTEDVRIVVNRIDRSASVSMKAAGEFLGRPVDSALPNDFPRASACVEEGRTLHSMASRSALARSYEELALLAHSWCGVPSPTRERKGLLGRFKGK